MGYQTIILLGASLIYQRPKIGPISIPTVIQKISLKTTLPAKYVAVILSISLLDYILKSTNNMM